MANAPFPMNLPRGCERLKEVRDRLASHISDEVMANLRQEIEVFGMTEEIEIHELLKTVLKLLETTLDARKFCIALCDGMLHLADELMRAQCNLKKHRRPKKYAERDAEIMRLHSDGKSAGKIVKVLASQWPLTDSMVRSVIRRNKKPA